MELKERVAFVGVGQCGNNFSIEMEKRGYDCLMINTSLEDMDAVKPKHKFHLEGGRGLAKEPSNIKALMSKNDNTNKLLEALSMKMIDDKDIIFVEFSAGGGTGNALGYRICKILASKGKIACPVVVIPNEEEEGVVICNNALNCLKNLEEADNIGATFIIDNKKVKNRMDANIAFSEVLDQYLTRTNTSSKGNMDESEFEELLREGGFSILTKVSRDKTTTNHLIDTLTNNIFADIDKAEGRPTKLGVSISSGKDINIKDLEAEFGFVYKKHVGYGGNNTLLILSGMQYPRKRIEEYVKFINNNKENILSVKRRKNESVFSDLGAFDDLFADEKEENNNNDAFADLFSGDEKSSKKLKNFLDF